MKTWQRTFIILIIAGAFSLLNAGVILAQSAIYGNRGLQEKLIGGIGLLPDVEPPAFTTEESQVYDRVVQLADDNVNQAIDELRALLAADNDPDTESPNAQFNYLLATLFYSENKYNNAIEQFRKAIEKWPTFRRAYKSLGVLLILQNRYQEAQQYLTKVIELGGTDPEIYNFLGTAYTLDENLAAAESAYRQAMLLKPGSDQFKLSLVRVLFSQEKWAEADALLQAMITKDPGNIDAWNLQANTYLGRQEFLKAATNWEILRAMGELSPEDLNKLATIYTSEKLYDLAADRFLEAFEKAGGAAVDKVLQAAEQLLARDASPQAERLLEEVRTSDTAELSDQERQQILRLEAKMLMDGGKGAEAAEILEQLVKQSPTDGDSLLKLGQYYRGEGEPEKALFYFERATYLPDFKANALVRLAQLKAEDMKEYGEALSLLRQAQQVEHRDKVQDYIEQIERFERNR